MHGSSNHRKKEYSRMSARDSRSLPKRIESLCSTHTQKVENWLDSQEVCLLLGFSKRTLQIITESSGRLAYSQIGSKIYYKSSDVERIIADSENTKINHPKQNHAL